MEGDPTDTVINFGDADTAMWNRGVSEGMAWWKMFRGARMGFLRAAKGCNKKHRIKKYIYNTKAYCKYILQIKSR